MGSLRRRYPAQQLRVNGPTYTNGHARGYAESEDEDLMPNQPAQQKTSRANSNKRRSYPLQHLSTDRLRQQRLLEAEEPEPDYQSREEPPAPAKQGSLRRRYPAQRLDGHYDRQANGYPQANGLHHDEYESDISDAGFSQSSSQRPSRADSARRRPYPAQSLPVDRLPRIEPSRENLQDETSMQQTPTASHYSSEKTIPDKGRQRAYPAQTLPIDKVVHPRPSRESISADLAAHAIPPTIHAVKDSETTGKRAGRTLVVCLDGTGDRFDNDNTNIVHFTECLKKDDPNQVTYYQAGIGTYSESQKISAGFEAAMDMAVGSSLGVHICDAYRFLMATYREGDRICLLGFSRGAYTARCLAGMVHKVGLLPAHNGAQVRFAYEMYKDQSAEGWDMSDQFKRTFCNDVRVHFIGVFDSVASVGFIPRKLPLSANPACQAAHFRHAMALDEHRAKFKCAYFTKSAEDAVQRGLVKIRHNDPETDVLQVWFAGCHADVGGGAVLNTERHMLSRIPLRWMIRQCFECDTGILFHSAALAEKGLDVHTLFPQYHALGRPSVGPPPSLMNKYEEGSLEPISRRSTALEERNASVSSNPFADSKASNCYSPGQPDDMIPEQVEDYFDALQPINDQLVDAWWKWAWLEFWPVKVRVPDRKTGGWKKVIRPNLKRYRNVPDTEPLMHWTVKQRMEGMGYKTKVRTRKEAGWRIVV